MRRILRGMRVEAKTGCRGCRASAGNMFWGECDKAKCCIEKGISHCGCCDRVPCAKLELLFSDPEHGDDGSRLCNLQNWKNGNYTYEKLNNTAQENAKSSDKLNNRGGKIIWELRYAGLTVQNALYRQAAKAAKHRGASIRRFMYAGTML